MNLLIKGVSEDQMQAIRVASAQAGKTIRDYVLMKLTGVGPDVKKGSGDGESPTYRAERNSVSVAAAPDSKPKVKSFMDKPKELMNERELRQYYRNGGK